MFCLFAFIAYTLLPLLSKPSCLPLLLDISLSRQSKRQVADDLSTSSKSICTCRVNIHVSQATNLMQSKRLDWLKAWCFKARVTRLVVNNSNSNSSNQQSTKTKLVSKLVGNFSQTYRDKLPVSGIRSAHSQIHLWIYKQYINNRILRNRQHDWVSI